MNLKTVNFLDVTLNIETGLFFPYMKPNNNIVYVNMHSNQPPHSEHYPWGYKQTFVRYFSKQGNIW